MGQDQPRIGVASPRRAATTAAPVRSEATTARGGWDSRLYAGLRLPCVSADARAALADALGQVGVEAEYFLNLIQDFPGPAPRIHATGDMFLARLEAAGQRLRRCAGTLEAASQGYLTELEAGYPSVRSAADADEVWWPPFAGYTLPGEPIEGRLRACGFAYRHVVAVHLASNIEAIAEHMALLLHALTTLPPAGILPASALYTGLYELTSTLQGYVIPNHLTDVNPHTPGLLTGIAQMRQLDAAEGNALESDIAWAHAQRAFARQTASTRSATASPPFAPLPDSQRWAESAVHEWDETIASLERMRH